MSNDKREKPLLDEARELATNYNKRATEFSERIKTLQSGLRRLEFRIKTRVDFDVDEQIHRLTFGEWRDTWLLYVHRKLPDGSWKYLDYLESCSVEIKVAAALAFPELLENLIGAQRDALDGINAAHTVLDDMAERIGRFEEEGE